LTPEVVAVAGLTRVMLPARNRRDCCDIPAGAREKLEFAWLERVDDAIAAALEGGVTPLALRAGVATQTEQSAVTARHAR
jgi:ATP-dependent Lon protease